MWEMVLLTAMILLCIVLFCKGQGVFEQEDEGHQKIEEQVDVEEVPPEIEIVVDPISKPTREIEKAILSECITKECALEYLQGMSEEELKSFRGYIRSDRVVESDKFTVKKKENSSYIKYSLTDSHGNKIFITFFCSYRWRDYENDYGFNHEECKVLCGAIEKLVNSKYELGRIIDLEIAKVKREKLIKDYCGGV